MEEVIKKPEVIEMVAPALKQHDKNGVSIEFHGPEAGTSKTELVPEETVDKVPLVRPILCAMVICIGSFSFGTTMSWPSPAIPNLNSHLNPFFIDDNQSSWIGSVLMLGALVGGLIGGPYMDHLGRKLSLISIQILFVTGWIVIAASSNFGCMVAGRVITGLAFGVVSLICPIYITEMAPTMIRGILGSCHTLFINFGIFLTACFGSILTWNWLAIFCAAFNLLLAGALCLIPESPRWLLAAGRKEEASHALRWLRGDAHDITAEIAYLERNILESKERASIRDFRKPELCKPLAICLFLMLFQEFSGINIIMFYSVQIFQDAGSDMDPYTQNILVGAVGIIGTLVSVMIIDLAGRRILLAVSATIMAISMAGIGAYFYEKGTKGHEVTTHELASWLPVTCLIVFNFGFDVAFGSVPWFIMGELFPQKAKGLAGGMSTMANWLFGFVITKFFNDMTKSALQTWGAYWFCCAFCVLAVPFSLFVVPETKGKTLEQIQNSFK